MEHIELERMGDVPLAFTGEPIAFASSQDPGKERWTEVRIWRLADERGWVVEKVGRSVRPGEDDRPSATHCATPQAVYDALMKSNSRVNGQVTEQPYTYMPLVCVDALVDAAAVDRRLADVAMERIR